MQPAASATVVGEMAQERTGKGQFLASVAVLDGQSWLSHLICEPDIEN